MSLDNQQALDIYKIAVEEYRFQVRLNWDRNKFYVLLNSSLITVACGLLKIPSHQHLELLMIPLFITGLIVAVIGFVTLTKGHEYYRKTVLKLAQLESSLGLSATERPIDTTSGMKESRSVLGEPSSFINRTFRIGTVTYYLAALFVTLMVANAFGIMFVFYYYNF